MVWRTSRFATFMRPRPRFPWKFNRPFYISRHLINWPCVTIRSGVVFFEGARAEIFVIDTSMRIQRGLKFFFPLPSSFPRIERASSFSIIIIIYYNLSHFDSLIPLSILKILKELDPMIPAKNPQSLRRTSIVKNQHLRFNWSLYAKKDESQKKKKKEKLSLIASNSINDLWPRSRFKPCNFRPFPISLPPGNVFKLLPKERGRRRKK